MEFISRKTLLYKSGLGFYCINHVQGCWHGCRYPCYAYMMSHSHGRINNFEEWRKPKLVVNAIELLSTELARMKSRPDTIHLCLSTDPFMNGYPEITAMSLKLIALINSYNIRCSILTKGKLPAELGDRERFKAENIYGISLISLNEVFREQYEPGTIRYSERIEALKYLNGCGRKTLVHMEPYPTPNVVKQELYEILNAIQFTDEIFFSGWNYNNTVKQFPNYQQFYREQSGIAEQFCREHKIVYNR